MNDQQTDKQMQVIDAAQVHELLPMSACIDAMANAMRAASNGEVAIPARMHAPLVDESAVMLVMPGSSVNPPYYGAKIVGMHPDNPAHGLPQIQGFIVLFEHETGRPAALIDAASVTAIRTAAASALATRELARSDARTLGIFGTGAQVAPHIEAIACVRELDEVRLWGRDVAKAARIAAEQSERFDFDIVVSGDAANAAACDIVATLTGSSEPIVNGAWLSEGTHLNLVGSHTATTREVDTAAVLKSRVFVDLRASAMYEAGDILIPIGEGAITGDHVVGEIGDVVSGRIPGRESRDDITLYKSLGIVAQDLFAAALVVEKAMADGTGAG